MSRKISNQKLARLLKEAQLGIKDIAVMAGANRTTVLRWTCGLPRPVLERKVARIFGVSVDELRLVVGLRQKRRGENERAIFDEAVKAGRRRRRAVCVWRQADGVGKFVNGGERFARQYPGGFAELQRIAAGVRRAAVMRDGTGDFWVKAISGGKK